MRTSGQGGQLGKLLVVGTRYPQMSFKPICQPGPVRSSRPVGGLLYIKQCPASRQSNSRLQTRSINSMNASDAADASKVKNGGFAWTDM